MSKLEKPDNEIIGIYMSKFKTIDDNAIIGANFIIIKEKDGITIRRNIDPFNERNDEEFFSNDELKQLEDKCPQEECLEWDGYWKRCGMTTPNCILDERLENLCDIKEKHG